MRMLRNEDREVEARRETKKRMSFSLPPMLQIVKKKKKSRLFACRFFSLVIWTIRQNENCYKCGFLVNRATIFESEKRAPLNVEFWWWQQKRNESTSHKLNEISLHLSIAKNAMTLKSHRMMAGGNQTSHTIGRQHRVTFENHISKHWTTRRQMAPTTTTEKLSDFLRCPEVTTNDEKMRNVEMVDALMSEANKKDVFISEPVFCACIRVCVCVFGHLKFPASFFQFACGGIATRTCGDFSILMKNHVTFAMKRDWKVTLFTLTWLVHFPGVFIQWKLQTKPTKCNRLHDFRCNYS